MLISFNWLKQFIENGEALVPETVGHELQMKTVEVEHIIRQGKLLGKVVVGQLVTVESHPNADKLRVCQVDVGTETLQIVCGGSNLFVGMKVALGLIGANVQWHGTGDPIVLVKSSIRGVDSFGMICGADEIGLIDLFPKKSEKEIVDLTHLDASVGTPLAQALGLDDVIFEIDNKSMSNRPDLWGHYGLSREVAAIFDKKLKSYHVKERKIGKEFDLQVRVEDNVLCPRYMAVAMTGIEVQPSPAWLQQRLVAVGVRPINNIVDITNYVMFELGQPMHAFDASVVLPSTSSGIMVVRRAMPSEKLLTLDEKERLLTQDMLVIANEEKPLAIAGIMGGYGSGVTESTHIIIFESATFAAANIRKTAAALGLRSDASARFEKSLDPEQAALALSKAIEMTLDLCVGATVASNVVDVSNYRVQQGPIKLSLDFIQQKIGVEIEKKMIIGILTRLGFVVEEKKEVLSVTIPSWRATKDIAIPEDIVEEIVRLYGIDSIPATLPVFPIQPPIANPLRSLERKIKEQLALEYGYTEVYNYSFVSPDWLKNIGIDTANLLELDNPVAKDRPFIRPDLIPNLLQNVEQNSHRFSTVRLFEIGRTFVANQPSEYTTGTSVEMLPKQDVHLGLVLAAKGQETPFYELSDVLCGLTKYIGTGCTLEKKDITTLPFGHPGRYADIVFGRGQKGSGVAVGYVGELHPVIQERLGIPYRTAFLDINLTQIAFHNPQPFVPYQPESQYPQIVRDSAFVVDRKVVHEDIVLALGTIDPLLVSIELFDVYEGKGMEPGKKSMAYHLRYQSTIKTLEAKDIEAVHARAEKLFVEKFGAELRKQ